MDWNSPDMNSWPARLVIRISKKIRSNKEFTQEAINKNNERDRAKRQQLRVQHAKANHYTARQGDERKDSNQDGVNELGEREYSAASEASTLVEYKDHTDMMHRLAHHDSFDSLVDQMVGNGHQHDKAADKNSLHLVSTKDEALVENMPSAIWQQIASNLTPLEAANLAISTPTMYRKLGSTAFTNLNTPENNPAKATFLLDMDAKLPRHLFCFICTTYHLRTQPGKEKLQPNFNANPLFNCPNARNIYLPRLRLTHGRELPYGFVQLALRNALSPAHGLNHENLSRRWKCRDSAWSHRTRYMVHDNRLLLRVVSTAFAPPAATSTVTVERHLLYDRQEYTPFFSVCAHWKDGDMMKLCKCALSHVPAPPESYKQQLRNAPRLSKSLAFPNFLVRGCDWCRPARRCPECPTEYMVEVQMVEDKTNPAAPFRHAIVVTRWSDLGDGTGPFASPEWMAVSGTDEKAKEKAARDGSEEYSSFSHVGRRAVSGIFESHISGSIPGERMLSLNPKNKKLGDAGHGWY